MIIPGANDPQSTDSEATTQGLETLALAIVLLPADFLGEVEVEVYGRVTDIATNETGEWKAMLQQQVSRLGSSAWAGLTGLSTVSGHSWASPISLQFSNSFSSTVGDDPSVWKLLVQGVDGKRGVFKVRTRVRGATFDN